MYIYVMVWMLFSSKGWGILTWGSSVCCLDSPVLCIDAERLHPAERFDWDPVLSKLRSWRWELLTPHNISPWGYSHSAWRKNRDYKKRLYFPTYEIIWHNVWHVSSYQFTYRALFEALTTGSSLRRAFSDAPYFFRSNTSSSCLDDSKMKTSADHRSGERSSEERLPELR